MPTSYPAHRPSTHTLNEADTCRVHITPALLRCGWGGPPWRIKEQYYFTDGQIILVGNGHRRQRGKKADYLLRYQESFPFAVVEAKAEDLDPAAGRRQILAARALHKDLPAELDALQAALLDQAFRGDM